MRARKKNNESVTALKEKTEHNDEPLFRDAEVSRAIKDMSPAKLSVKDVYFRLCACLDREIELVWKRAVFLTAFLIAAFAGYGGLIATYLGAEEHHAGDFAIVSIAAIGIAFVGIVLSVIWIMMAKGSKAWQEHYEKVIECYVSKHKSDDELQNICASGYYVRKSHSSILDAGLKREEISFNLFKCTGGAYSVSKIVIGIGIGSLFLWLMLLALHFVYLTGHVQKFCHVLLRFFGNWIGCAVGVVAMIAFAVVIWIFIRQVTGVPFMSDYLDLVRKQVACNKEKRHE